jgi:hypothetical protein
MKKTLTMGIVLVLLLACIGITSAFANGGFEAPVNTQNWQVYPDGYADLVWTVEQGLGADPSITPTLEIQKQAAIGLAPYEGEQFAELDSYANVNISQMISTNPGKTYKISFAQACRSDGGENPGLLGVYWGDTYLGQTSCTDTKTWLTHTYSPTASSAGQVRLMFVDEGASNSYGVLLDSVSIVEEENNVPVPEFPTVALPAALIVGLIGVILLIQKSKEN